MNITTGKMVYQPWDSEQLGVKACVVDWDINPQVLEKSSCFALLRIPVNEICALNDLIRIGAYYVGTELHVSLRKNGNYSFSKDLSWRVDIQERCDYEPFLDFVYEKYFSRFLRDGRLPQEKMVKIWQSSLKNYCSRKVKHSTLCSVLYVKGEAAGLWILDSTSDGYKTPFIGIRQQFRQMCLSVPFMCETMRQLGMTRAQTEIFADNVGSCKMHQRAGYEVVGAAHILHFMDSHTYKQIWKDHE